MSLVEISADLVFWLEAAPAIVALLLMGWVLYSARDTSPKWHPFKEQKPRWPL